MEIRSSKIQNSDGSRMFGLATMFSTCQYASRILYMSLLLDYEYKITRFGGFGRFYQQKIYDFGPNPKQIPYVISFRIHNILTSKGQLQI